THRRRERKPVGEQQAGKYPEERQYHIEKRRWMKCHEQNGRDEGADDDGRLHQQPIEPRTGHAEAHEQKDKYRRELTTWHMERIRQYRCEAACERSFQRMRSEEHTSELQSR